MKRLPSLYIRISACLVILIGVGWVSLDWYNHHLKQEKNAHPVADHGDMSGTPNPGQPPLVSINPALRANDVSETSLPSAGRELLMQCRQNLHQFKPFSADLIQAIRIGENPILARGRYIEGEGNQLRMELEIETKNTRGKLLNVSDGSILWTELKRHSEELSPDEEPKITRRDLGMILQAAETNRRVDSAQYVSDLAVGGLTALFTALEKEMTFQEPVEVSQSGVSMLSLRGTWNQAFLDRHSVSNISRLPRHIPDSVELFLDRATLFPRRIMFTRQDVPGDAGKLITFDFTNVDLQTTLLENIFDYNLADNSYDDVTYQYLRRLPATE
ncbi:MAG: hypothetical protein R3C11_19295 [Planctomycetaceae bacterium]